MGWNHDHDWQVRLNLLNVSDWLGCVDVLAGGKMYEATLADQHCSEIMSWAQYGSAHILEIVAQFLYSGGKLTHVTFPENNL